MTDGDEDAEVVHGRVKWFDPGKGFGFIVAEGLASDVLLHANVLRNYGQGSVADGAQIVVRATRTPRGMQAVEVVSIERPEVALALPIVEEAGISPDEVAGLPFRPVRVKWFDKAKGFGFANVFGSGEDIFIHIEVLRHSGLAELQPGEALAMRIVNGKRGRMAVQIAPWDSVQLSEV
jgi:CspA family cold shock protein